MRVARMLVKVLLRIQVGHKDQLLGRFQSVSSTLICSRFGNRLGAQQSCPRRRISSAPPLFSRARDTLDYCSFDKTETSV